MPLCGFACGSGEARELVDDQEQSKVPDKAGVLVEYPSRCLGDRNIQDCLLRGVKYRFPPFSLPGSFLLFIALSYHHQIKFFYLEKYS